MKINKKWSVRDVITTVLLSVLVVVIQLAVNMICMVNNFVSMVLSVGIGCFLCAPIYFLMISRVRKRFMTLFYMTILGVVFLLMGNWFILPYFVVVGAVLEAILWRQGSFDNPKRITLVWVLYSVLFNGVNLLPLWFFWDAFEQNAIAGSMSPEYIASYISYYSDPKWLTAIFIITAICGFSGSLLGKKITNKHFKKAGVL